MTPWDASVAGDLNPSANIVEIDSAPRTFSFELDDDLVKIVTIWTTGTTCFVNVRYGRDVLIDEQEHVFEAGPPITLEQTPFGVIVHATRRGFPWLGRRLRRKF